MRPPILKTKRFWIVALFVAMLLGALAWLATSSNQPILDVALPSPNGYDDFIAAEAQLPERLPESSEPNKEALSRVLAEHASALVRARQGLVKECRVPLDYSPGALTNGLQGAGPARNLGFLFRDEGGLAELNSNYTQAAQCYLDGIHYGAKRFYGGLLVDQLVGSAVTKFSGTRLQALLPNLNADECQKALALLLEVDSAEEPVEVVLERDEQWSLRVTRTWRIHTFIYRFNSQIRKAHAMAKAKLHERTRFRRSLIIGLARRAFESETGKTPESIEVLVPKYLPQLPKDPTTGIAMNLGE